MVREYAADRNRCDSQSDKMSDCGLSFVRGRFLNECGCRAGGGLEVATHKQMLRIGRATAALLAVSARSAARHGLARSVISVTDTFDSGNIECVESASDDAVRLRIKPDPFTELEKKSHMQWFAFRATVPRENPMTVTYTIENAGDCSFAVAWKGAEVVASTDRNTWRRIPSTRYDEVRPLVRLP